MSSYIGNKIKITIFGQSHSDAVGTVIEGLPSGILVDKNKLEDFLKRRAPKLDTDTGRKEEDEIEILSGTVGSYTCGTAFCAIIKNTNRNQADYQTLKKQLRPGHCDYPAYARFGCYHDFSGGGHFSGRLTAALCIAGGLFLQILKERGIEISAHIANIGSVSDKLFHPVHPSSQMKHLQESRFPVIQPSVEDKMLNEMNHYRSLGDSIGGSIECALTGIPAGSGSVMFDSLESRISQLAFAVPAVKAIEFGQGVASSKMTGSEYNDPYYIENNEISTLTNHCGGILGGLSTGMPLLFRVFFKPVPSIFTAQKTVDLSTMQNTELCIKGRHDTCIVPRAVPIIESVAAIACYDLCD